MKEVDLGATAPYLQLSHPQPHLLHDVIVVYTQRGVSRRKKVGQDYCLPSFAPVGLEVDSERTSLGHLECDDGYMQIDSEGNPLPEVIFILSALADTHVMPIGRNSESG